MTTLFRCERCNCVDDIELASPRPARVTAETYLCSECQPVINSSGKIAKGQWHGLFPKRLYDPMNDFVLNVEQPISFS